MVKKFSLWLLVVFAAVALIPGLTVLAAPELTVSVSVGFDGKSKFGKSAPVTFTIENSGSSFSGDLVIDVQESYNLGTGRVIPITIESGESKTVSLTLQNSTNGHGFGSSNNKQIYLYEGGWEKGEEIPHKGTQQLNSPTYSPDSAFIVMLTTNVDRLTALKNVSVDSAQTTQLINASKVDSSKLPDETLGWESVDFLLIDEYPIADLSPTKQEALLGWVRSGGILIIGGSDNIEGELGIFSDYLPLTLNNLTEVSPAILNEWTATTGFENPIPSYETELKEDAMSILEADGNPLVAYKKVEDGLIYQTAFSVGDDPLAKASGMSTLWSVLLKDGGRSFQTNNFPHQSPLESLSYTVGNINELFPSFKVSAPLLFGIIIFYIVLIIPILYWVLKRKDKREYTWWLIPIIAIVTSIAIFGYGAKDRIGRTQIQHSAILNVVENGLTGYFAESLLSNKSGDFTFTAPENTTLYASIKQDLFGSNTNAMHKNALVEKDIASSSIHLRNIGFWDVATVIGETRVEKMGEIATQLTVKDKNLTGSVTNEFPFTLTDVSIWSGTSLLPIGDIGPGETVKIEQVLQTSFLLPKSPMYSTYSSPTQSVNDTLIDMRKNNMLSFSGDLQNIERKPVIIGYTDTQIIPVTLDKGKPSLSALTLIVQPIEVDIAFEGSIIVEPEMMAMNIHSEDTKVQPDSVSGLTFDEYYFNDAVYIQTWQIPEKLVVELNSKWSSIDLTKVQNRMYTISLLNVTTGLFEQQEVGDIKLTENIDDYISSTGEVVFRIEFHDSKNGNHTYVPELKVTAEVAR